MAKSLPPPPPPPSTSTDLPPASDVPPTTTFVPEAAKSDGHAIASYPREPLSNARHASLTYDGNVASTLRSYRSPITRAFAGTAPVRLIREFPASASAATPTPFASGSRAITASRTVDEYTAANAAGGPPRLTYTSGNASRWILSISMRTECRRSSSSSSSAPPPANAGRSRTK